MQTVSSRSSFHGMATKDEFLFPIPNVNILGFSHLSLNQVFLQGSFMSAVGYRWYDWLNWVRHPPPSHSGVSKLVLELLSVCTYVQAFWWLRCTESACSVGDLGSIPGSGRSTGKRTGNPLATYSSFLAQRISWTEEPGGLVSMGLQRAGHE